MSNRYGLAVLGGCALGLVVFLFVALTNRDSEVTTGGQVLIGIGAVALGGLLAFLRVYVRDRGQRAGEKLRD